MRVGILPHDMTKTPEVEQAFQRAVDMLELCGLNPVPAELPQTAPINSVASFIIMAEGSAAHREFILGANLNQLADSVQQAGLLAGLAITTSDYIRAQQIRTVAVNQLNRIWQDFDILVAPTLLTEALPADRPFVDNDTPWGGNGGTGNLAGWPSISLPMGFGPNGLPLGLELIAPPFHEGAILDVAHAYQKATDWHLHIPGNV
jgi:aspartyl-tRNA(Asn)/glutamyl-tRNA(Gln) amidotransferase subunit A